MLDRGDREQLPWVETTFGRRVVGAGVILAALALILFATLRPNPFKDTQTIRVEFDSVRGLGRIDRNVRVAGANLGEVGDVKRTADDVVVELKLDPDILIHEDARAALRPHTLFEGSAFIDLHPGSPSAPPLEGGAIPQRQTSVYVSLDEATRVLRKSNRDALRDLVGSGAKLLRGQAITGLRKTLKRAPELVRELGPTARALRGPEGDELGHAIRGLSQTVAWTATREEQLLPLVQRANRTLAALDVDGGAALDAALAALPGPLEELREGGDRLTAVIDRLDRLAVEGKPFFEELAPLLRDSRPLLRRATPIVRDATPLVAALGTVLARSARAAPTLKRIVEEMRPGTRILVESVLPFLTADTKLGVPGYEQLISAFTGGTAALRPYQTAGQGLLGEGHVLRLGAYLDPAFFGSIAVPSCAVIALIDPGIADGLEALGLCQP
jgi:ABC-type transporter Mla subunit MlaD